MTDPSRGQSPAARHICLADSNEAVLLRANVAFVADGWRGNRACLGVCTAECETKLLTMLAEAGFDCAEQRRRGRLRLCRPELYLRGGGFDVQAGVRSILDEVEHARIAGYEGLHFFGYPDATLAAGVSAAEVLALEAALNDVPADTPWTLLCLYDGERLDPAITWRGLRSHPLIAYDCDVVENACYRPTLSGSPGDSALTVSEFGALLAKQEGRNRLWRQEKRELTENIAALEEAVSRATQMAEDLAVSNHIKDEFVRSLGEEWRTAVNTIVGFADLLATDDLTEAQRDHVRVIAENARHLSVLMRDMIDFARVEAGDFNLHLHDCSMSDLLEGVDSLMRCQASAKGLRFDIDLGARLPKVIHSDSVRLRQCLVKLIDNAIKFTERGGVRVVVAGADSHLRFQVRDTGPGIAPERLARIFDTFSHGDDLDAAGRPGFGLTIAKRLAQALGGDIEAASTLGQGSTFTLVLPTHDGGAASTS